MNFLTTILIFLITISTYNALFLNLKGKEPYCLYKDVKQT